MRNLRRHLGRVFLARVVTAVMLTLVLLSTAGVARADIYGYIDADGAGHFSTEKLDDRYQLFMHGDAAFDSSQVTTDRPAPLNQKLRDSPLFSYLSQHPNLKKYAALVDQAAHEFALEPALLKAVMAAESGFDPGAVSPKGAIGLMQIMPATAERYGLSGDHKKPLAQKLTDPRTNIRLGARYLRDLRNMFPSRPDLVIASYNAGEGAVQKYNNQIPPFPETRNYVQLVRQFYQLYKPTFGGIAISSNDDSNGDSSGSNLRRVHLVLPGRSNMPPPLTAASARLNPPAMPSIPLTTATPTAATPFIE